MVRLTFDLYDHIIEQLANIDIRSIRNCALVCSDFLRLSRRHLFRSITLDSTKPKYTRRLERLLNRNPSIVRNIRDVTLEHNINQRNIGPHVLNRLHRVRKFTLQLCDGTECDFCGDSQYDWGGLSARHRTYFYSFIRSNTIVHLTLANIQNISATFLRCLPYLAVLEVDNVSMLDSPFDRSHCDSDSMGIPKLVKIWSRRSNLIPLQNLLGDEHSNIMPAVDLTYLEDIGVALDDDPAGMEFLGFVLQNTENLKSVTLSASDECQTTFKGKVASKLNKHSLKTLKTIKMMVMIEDHETDPYLSFMDELEQIGGKNVLETLSIEIEAETNCHPTTELSKWAELSRVLAATDAFPHLRSVSLKVTLNWCLNTRPDELQARLQHIGVEVFRSLRENDKVKVVFDVVVWDV
ncbi:hypothetical protein JR316_0005357 [Psilocybe cubensis]|uniref:F-box domain-containing protein n=2 Tax=Psilocybe cubensis TaxID=181762 RepID=A0A8H7XKM3_PSICU|nr:hypothetical protein JR316_0005357 [Psilocybe cubensis]KAH9483253.1 hypothetical protein JR316_0005357 [Psilocybe cubensis]